MPLSLNEIRERARAFAREWAGESSERAEAQESWNEPAESARQLAAAVAGVSSVAWVAPTNLLAMVDGAQCRGAAQHSRDVAHGRNAR